MKSFCTVCAIFLISLITLHVFADVPAAAVRADQTGQTFSLDNGLVTVQLNAATGLFTASSAGTAFVRDGRLGEGVATGEISPSLANGKAIVLTSADHTVRQVSLYPGVPFVLLSQRIAAAAGDKPSIIDRVTPIHLPITLDKPLQDLRIVGC